MGVDEVAAVAITRGQKIVSQHQTHNRANQKYILINLHLIYDQSNLVF